MEFSIKNTSPETTKTACIIVPVFESNKISTSTKLLDTAADSAISKIIRKGDIKGKVGQTLLLHYIPGIKAERVLLVGCGDSLDMSENDYRKSCAAAIAALTAIGVKEAVCCLQEVNVQSNDLPWKIAQATRLFAASEDRRDQMKSEKGDDLPELKLSWYSSDKTNNKDIQKAINLGSALAKGMRLTKELGDLPGNICTPTYLANQAKALQKEYPSIKTTIMEEKQMEQLGMGALLSVSRGSRQPAKLITMEYKGGRRGAKPVVLVGKGLTFDSGGVSIKPSQAMDEMKYDMCGAGTVFGVIKAIAELKLPINVTGVIPSSENMPDGDANKPGDIVTSMSGLTIEVLNTDAEGRLILCDALTYCEKYKPEIVIDMATLTGACIVALGNHTSGLLANNQELADDLLAAGEIAGDKCWQLPMGEEYQEQLKSNFADLANIGGPGAGTITAACFLSRFTEDYTWAHLDIAGTAWKSGGADKGASGRPVPLVVQYLINRSKK